MPLAIAFWVIMLIWVVLGLYQSGVLWLTGPNVLLFLLIALLGWKTFGSPFHG